MCANTQCHSKGWVDTAIFLIARYGLSHTPPHPPGSCLNVVTKWLNTRPLEKESVSEKDHQCEGVQGEGEIENWKQLMSSKEEQAQKQTMENSSGLLFVPELPSTNVSVLPSICCIIHRFPLLLNRSLKGPSVFFVWNMIRTLGLEDLVLMIFIEMWRHCF